MLPWSFQTLSRDHRGSKLVVFPCQWLLKEGTIMSSWANSQSNSSQVMSCNLKGHHHRVLNMDHSEMLKSTIHTSRLHSMEGLARLKWAKDISWARTIQWATWNKWKICTKCRPRRTKYRRSPVTARQLDRWNLIISQRSRYQASKKRSKMLETTMSINQYR